MDKAKQVHQSTVSNSVPDGVLLANLGTLMLMMAYGAFAAFKGLVPSVHLYALGLYFAANLLVSFFWKRTPDNAVKKAVAAWLSLGQWLFMIAAVVVSVTGNLGGLPLNKVVALLGVFGAFTVVLSYCMVWVISQTGPRQMKAFAATGGAIILGVLAIGGPLVRQSVMHEVQHTSAGGAHSGGKHMEADELTTPKAEEHREILHGAPQQAHGTTGGAQTSGSNHESSASTHDADVHAVSAPTSPHNDSNTHALPQSGQGKEVAALSQQKVNSAPHWGYEGAIGPKKWGLLASQFETCERGHEQSPVDIPKKTKTMTKWALPFILPSELRIVDNGHTIQVNYDNGSKVVIDGQPYETKQMHYHSPSEHEINGVSWPLELHVVNQGQKGQLAVLGIMVEKGRENSELAKILANLPAHGSGEKKVEGVNFNISKLLPKVREFYHYPGSLTTPPCSEGVSWNVFTTAIEASEAQIQAFRERYNRNNRPIQPFNERQFGKGLSNGAAAH